MKIIKKPKIKKPQTCKVCGTIVKLKIKNLEPSPCSFEKESWICPVCGKRNLFCWKEESTL